MASALFDIPDITAYDENHPLTLDSIPTKQKKAKQKSSDSLNDASLNLLKSNYFSLFDCSMYWGLGRKERKREFIRKRMAK